MSKIFKNQQKNGSDGLKKRKFKQILFIFFFILIDIVLVFNLSDIFSSIITHKKGLFSSGKVEFNSFSFYCVSLKHFSNESDADVYAREVAQKGGMGKVYQNGEFYVFANIYPNLIEAQEIKENLVDLGYDARIVKFSTPSILFSYKGKNLQIIYSVLNFLRQTPVDLCNLSIDFDSKTFTRATLNGKLASFIDETDNLVKTLSNCQTKNDEFIFKILSDNLNFFQSILEKTIVFDDNFEGFSCQLKQAIFEVVLHVKDTFSQF